MEQVMEMKLDEQPINNEGKLSIKTKLSYGLGNLSANLVITTANAFISYFYTDSVGIAAAMVGIILLAGRILDGIADIVMGIVVDRTKTKYGKARPWLLRLALPYGLAMVLLFTTPSLGENGNVVYALVSYLFAMFIYTGINVPYNTLLAMQTQEQNERTQLSAYRTSIGFVGALLINIVTIPLVNALGGGSQGWLIMAIIYGAIGSALYFNCFLNCREMTAEESLRDIGLGKVKEPSLRDGVKSLLKNKYWVMVIIMGVIGNLTAGLGGVNIYYAQYVLGNPNLVGLIGLASFLPIIAGVVMSGPLMVKFGKRNISMAGCVVAIIGCIPLAVGYDNIPMIVAGLIVRGLGSAPILVASLAMISDSLEYGEWKTGVRAEGLTFSAQSFSEKVGAGLGGALLGGILALGGYVGGAAEQSASAIMAMKIAFIYAQAGLMVIVLAMLYFYHLDEEYPQILAELQARKGILSKKQVE